MKISKERYEKLKRIAQVHDAWVKENLDKVKMRPARSHRGSDYNLHYLDVDAPPEIEADFQRRLRMSRD